jgi:hypothetical protein
MIKGNALLISSVGYVSSKSGIVKRVEEISSFLEELGFQVEIATNLRLGKCDTYDLICISSFTNAFQIFAARKKTSFLWFDAMDSWRLTRRSLFTGNPVRESVKLLREIFGRPLIRIPDLITYCSLRDAQIDKSDFRKTLIFGPGLSNFLKLSDFGYRYVFVGPSSYYPNNLAVKFLFEIANLGYFAKTKLHIYGEQNNYNQVHEDVYLHGEAPDIEVYGNRDIHLVPLWKGAGIKYKTLLPLSRGLKVISSLEGANGLNPTSNLIIANDQDHFKELLRASDFLDTPKPPTSKLLTFDQRIEIREILEAQINTL